jgi:hypothetical protein
LDYHEVNPRTVFNFAPGPRDFLDSKGDYIVLNKRDSDRGFSMSQPANMREIVPPTPINSPRQEPTFVRRGPGLKDRFSGIRGSSLTGNKNTLDRGEELRAMRELAARQSSLPGFKKMSVIPPISRKGGKLRRSKTKKANSKKLRKPRRR